MRLPRQPGLDLRLLVPAVVLWVVSWFAALLPARWSIGGGIVACLGAAMAGRCVATSRLRTVVALGAAVAGVCAIGVGLRVMPLTSPPWHDADPNRSMKVVAVVTGDPQVRIVSGWGGADQVQASVDCRVEQVTEDGSSTRTRVPVHVIGYGPDWAGLTWGADHVRGPGGAA